MAAVSVTMRADVWLEAAKSIKQGSCEAAANKSLTFTFDNAPATGMLDITLPDGKKKNH